MLTTSIRTRGPIATATVACVDGQEHRFTINSQGVITNPHHDPSEDDVIVSLGGRPSPCGQAVLAYRVARSAYRSLVGIEDIAVAPLTLAFGKLKGWRTSGECRNCPTWGSTTIGHSLSLEHQLESLGYAELIPAAKVMLRWMHRVGQVSQLPRNRAEVTNLLPSLPVEENSWIARTADLVTVSYIRQAHELTALAYSGIVPLRNVAGLSVQWLRELNSRMTSRGKARFKIYLEESTNAGETAVRILGPARNLPASEVARFLNAGIYSYIHTYVRNGVRPDQVITVYKSSSGSRPLAEFLKSGKTVRQAIAEVCS